MPSNQLETPRLKQTLLVAETGESIAIEAQLRQLYSSYQQGQFGQVITHCEAIMAHCQQQMKADPAQKRTNQPSPDHQLKQASSVTTSLSKSQAETTAQLYLAKGDLFGQQGKNDEAIRVYEQLLELQPQRTELLKKIGALYGQKAQKEKANNSVGEAVRVYLKALQKHPRLFLAYNRLRYNLMRYDISAGEPILKEVVQVCQKIVEQDPTILPAQITLGYALTKAGFKEQAIACYSRASELFTRRQISDKTTDLDATAVTFLQQPQQPHFMIIGAEKSGTTSLYQYLRQHPDVLPSVEKEIDFFDLEYDQGVDWYLAHFPPVLEQTIPHAQRWLTGETSANYLYSDIAPERVFQNFPHIKLAVILRNPIDRTVSRYNMMVRNGVEQRSLETAIQEEIALIQDAIARSGDDQIIPWRVLNRCRHVGNSLYYYHLQRWLSLFPSEHLFVLKSEELFTQPAQALSHLYSALGLSSHTIQAYPKHNSGQYSPAEQSVRQTLSTFFAPHTHKLETLLDRSFGWGV